jgi:hypothetical protein
MLNLCRHMVLALLALLAIGPGNAQTDRQHLLDTMVASSGVLSGYLTASGDQVLRIQLGPAMELRRFAEDGTPIWRRGYIVPFMDWTQSPVVSDDAEGSFMAGGPVLQVDGNGMPVLSQFLMHIDGNGSPSWSVALEWDLEIPDLDDFVPTTQLIRTTDGACIVVLTSTEPGYSAVRLTKVAADGEVQWSRTFIDPMAEAGPAWGSTGTTFCADDAGGLYLARHDQGPSSLSVARVNANGDVFWVRRYTDPAGYTMQAYDIAVEPSGELLVLGRLIGLGLPSGGSLLRIAPDGTLLRADLYQWELGRRLFVRADGSLATVSSPWLYLLDEQGSVYRTHSFQEWVVEPHRYVFTTTNMDVANDRLWMQGVLRKIVIQFATQTVRPAFFSHSIDAVEGCKWNTGDGFARTELGVSDFAREDVNGAVTIDLLPLLNVQPREIELSIPAPLGVDAFCEQAVGIAANIMAESAGFRLASNPPAQSDVIELLDVAPGTLHLHDLQGRSIWRGETTRGRDRWSIPIGFRSSGLFMLHWRALDGSSTTVEKVLIP